MNKALVLVMCDVLVLSAMSLSSGTFSSSGLSGNDTDSKSFTKKEIDDAKVKQIVELEKYKSELDRMFLVSTKSQHTYSEVEYNKYDEVFFLFGKETKGLPEDILQKYIDKTIRIPMRETLRSLNLSNSVAIVAYDIFRQAKFDNLEEISSYFG
jgi:tRNA (cytidine/uridine-2'-O-)-methyltransferase